MLSYFFGYSAADSYAVVAQQPLNGGMLVLCTSDGM